ncbi:Putative aliphatic sulfonates transport permease protein SsuC [Roseibium album]|nr:Putative aliphatic sulfonates transport permease protein SsuC [Roseibium album]
MSKLGRVANAIDDKTVDPEPVEKATGVEKEAVYTHVSGLSGEDVAKALGALLSQAADELRRNATTIFLSLVSLTLGLLVWHLATSYKVDFYINFQNVPSPAKVFSAFWTHLGDTEFYIHIGVSMQRILTGYITAAVIGIAAGVFMGRSKLVRSLIYPYIEVLRPIPAVAWIPLAILMWPTEEASIIYITLLGALFPIVLNTLHGVEQTPEVLVRAAKSLGASQLQIFWHVILPSALPSIAAGLAIGMGVSWFSLLAGEIISGQYGIGYFTWDAYSLINYPDIVVGMLVIGGLGTLSTYAVKLAMKPLLAWQKRAR